MLSVINLLQVLFLRSHESNTDSKRIATTLIQNEDSEVLSWLTLRIVYLYTAYTHERTASYSEMALQRAVGVTET